MTNYWITSNDAFNWTSTNSSNIKYKKEVIIKKKEPLPQIKKDFKFDIEDLYLKGEFI